jgi:hypothetical protein
MVTTGAVELDRLVEDADRSGVVEVELTARPVVNDRRPLGLRQSIEVRLPSSSALRAARGANSTTDAMSPASTA